MTQRTAGHLMTRAGPRFRIEETVAVQDLRRALARTRYLPVVDGQRKFRGFVTRTDILALSGKPADERVAIQGLLWTSPQVREDEPLESAARVLLKARAHVVPVVDREGRLLGLLTDHKLLRSLLPRRRPAPPEATPVEVDTVMTRNPIFAGPESTVEQAASALLEANIRHLPVVDTDRRVIGILSERDLRERIGGDMREWFHAAGEVLQDEVGRLMTPDPVTVREGSSLTEALETLENERVGALPVVDEDDRLVGILSYVDALAWMRDVLSERRSGGAEPSLSSH